VKAPKAPKVDAERGGRGGVVSFVTISRESIRGAKLGDSVHAESCKAREFSIWTSAPGDKMALVLSILSKSVPRPHYGPDAGKAFLVLGSNFQRTTPGAPGQRCTLPCSIQIYIYWSRVFFVMGHWIKFTTKTQRHGAGLITCCGPWEDATCEASRRGRRSNRGRRGRRLDHRRSLLGSIRPVPHGLP